MDEVRMAIAGTDAVKTKSHGGGLASGLMLLTTFFWASNLVAGKEALTGFSPLALAQLRMAAAAILYIVLYIAWRGLPTAWPTKRQWLILGLMAFTGITMNQICYIGGLAKTSVTHGGLIQAIGPIMVLLLAAAMGMERLTSGKILGMTISFAGVAMLLIEKPAAGSGATSIGDLILIAAGGFFAYYTILMKKVADCFDPLTLNALVFVLGAIFLIPFCAFPVAHVRWGQISAYAWWGLVFMVLFGSLVSYLIYAFALQKLSASNVAAFSYLQPVMAALMGIWLLGEKVSLKILLGGALILFGVYLTERVRGERKHIQHLATGRV